MCSLTDEFDGNEFLQKQENNIINLNGLMCQKCNTQKAEVTLRKKDVYCNHCFLINATHKFRATVGKSKLVRPSDTILVTHDGKIGSTALLNLIKSGMDKNVHKRLMYGVKVLYINDGLITKESSEEMETKIKHINEQIECLGFQAYGVALSEAMNYDDSSILPLKNLPLNGKNDEKLSDIWNKLIDETSKKDFQQKLRNKLMVFTAKSLKCQKIFLADDSASLAIDILSNVSLGRGAQLSPDCGAIDNRNADVMIMRPMRDFSRRELHYYLKICDLKCVDDEQLKDNSKNSCSIQKLTGKFVTDLEDQFNGTVSTIFRTSAKISVGKESQEKITTDDFCVFCNGCLDTTPLDNCTSSIEATNFSRIVSAKGSHAELDLEKLIKIDKAEVQENSCGDCRCGRDRRKEDHITYDDMRELLCYSCRLIFHDNFDMKTLPSYMTKSVIERLRLKSIAAEIQDFLL